MQLTKRRRVSGDVLEVDELVHLQVQVEGSDEIRSVRRSARVCEVGSLQVIRTVQDVLVSAEERESERLSCIDMDNSHRH